ncbi:MAG: GNAT family N-acetyltransferase, partial [Pseudomonadota bacterium]
YHPAMTQNHGGHDVRQTLDADHHTDALAAPQSAADAPVEIRLARPEDAEGVAHCFFAAYGGSYDHGWVYQPDALRLRWADRSLVSVVGLAPDGELVGHLAANFTGREAKVAQAGQAVVNPRFRGHHLFESMKRHLAGWAEREGLYGLFSQATTAHPYSQRGNLALGAHEMGFIFNYIPSSVDYKHIAQGAAARRKTAAQMYLRTNREPTRIVHLPPEYRQVAERVYRNAGFARELGGGDGASNDTACRLHSERDLVHQAAILFCANLGTDAHAVIADHLADLKKEDLASIWLDLPLADPNLYAHGAALKGLGFTFCCILPEAREDGDVLRLQYVSGADLNIGEIATSSDFGQSLLDDIAAEIER